MNQVGLAFFIERLTNGAWVVGWREGHDDYGRIPSERSGFDTYSDAERFAIAQLKLLLRNQRDKWAKADKTAKKGGTI